MDYKKYFDFQDEVCEKYERMTKLVSRLRQLLLHLDDAVTEHEKVLERYGDAIKGITNQLDEMMREEQ